MKSALLPCCCEELPRDKQQIIMSLATLPLRYTLGPAGYVAIGRAMSAGPHQRCGSPRFHAIAWAKYRGAGRLLPIRFNLSMPTLSFFRKLGLFVVEDFFDRDLCSYFCAEMRAGVKSAGTIGSRGPEEF